MKKLLLLVTLAFLAGLTLLSAQGINEYTYSTSTDGTLEDMTGSTALLTVGTYYDDTASIVTNIGFTFAFGTGGYTQFSANSNGQMQLGATAISGGAASPALNTPRLAPLSGDNAIRATGKLHYKLFGSSPNQKLVVEWLDLRVNYSSSTETGTYCRMQAWLYETSNNIKFVYGTMYNMSTSAQTRGVYISTSNLAGTVGNWETITATPTWTVTGTSVVATSFALSSSMINLNSAADGSRRVFSMNYPVYTTAPNAAVLVSPANGGWAIIGSTLNWQSGGGGATSYDVYFGVSPALNFIGNQGSTTYTPTLVAGTTYTWRIDARNAFGATTGTVWNFKAPSATQVQESFENTTFPPAGWTNPGTWSRSTSYYKNGVASAYKYGSASAQYVLSTPKVTITGTSNLDLWTLASATTGTLQVVWSPDRVTWTQVGGNITHAATYAWYNTIVDLSSLAGNNYYLGIRTGLQAVSFYVDMIIGPEITPEVPGPPTLSLPASGASGVSIYPTFTWTAPTTGGVPTGYKIYCDGSATPTTQIGTSTGLTFTPTTPLAYITPYYWTVKATNGAGDGTAPTATAFTTMADPTVSIFPYTESFDGTTFAPTGWSNNATVGANLWDRQTAGTYPTCAPYSGAGMARYNSYSATSGNKAELVTPPLAIPNGQNFRVKFWMYRDNGYDTYTNELINVYVNSSPNSTGGTLLGTIHRIWNQAPIEVAANAWYQYTFVFTGSTTNKYLTFEAVSQFGNNMFIDHVLVEAVPVSPILLVTPSDLSHDFGAVVVDSPATMQYTIMNNGGGTITINSVTASGTYYSISVQPADLSLSAGESTTFTVRYLPTAVGGPYTGSAIINYTASTRPTYTISLSGTCYDPRVTLPYSENFDGGTPVLTIAPADSWVIGTPAKTYLIGANSGANALVTRNLTSTYNASEDSNVSLIINTAPLSADIIVEFMQKFYTEAGYDALTLEYSIDNQVSWIKWDANVGTGVNFDTATSQFWYNSSSTSGPITPPKWSGTNSGSIFGDDVNGWLPSFTVIPYSLFGAAGNLSLRWHFGSDTSLQYDGFAIDDISIREVLNEAPGLVTLDTPADEATGVNFYTASLSWSPAETGGIPTGYEGWLSTEPGAATDLGTLMSGDWFESTSPSIAMSTIPSHAWEYSTTYYWGILPSNTWGSPDPEDPAFQIFSFTTIADPAIVAPLPHIQNFDGVTAPALPLGWTAYKSYSSSSLVTSTSYAQSTPNAVYFYNSTTTETMRLISPQVLVPMNSFKVSFYLRASSTGYTMKVGTVSALDGTGVFTEIASISPTTSAVFTQYTVSFLNYSGGDQYICFQHGVTSTYQSFYLDNVLIEQLMPNDLAATGITGPSLGIAGVQNTYNITVLNNGTASQTVYNIHLKRIGDDRLASLPVNFLLAPNASQTFAINWTPATSGSYNLVGEVELAGDGNAVNNETTTVLATIIYPAGSFIPQIGDITSTTTTNYLPVDVYYKNSLNETIYLPQEMQCSSGTIRAMIFQNNFTQDVTKEIKVWMMNTTASDLAAAYLDPTNYILVADVMVHFPLGVNAVVIPLDTPFSYTGGNLAVRTYRVWESVYWLSTNTFYYTADLDHPNRDRYYYYDGTGPIDPFALTLNTLDGGTAFTGTVTNFIPNTAFIISPATPITTLPAPTMTGSTIGTTTGTLTWAAVPGAYAYRVYATTDPYNWPTTPIATVHTTTYTGTIVPFMFYRVTAITTYRNVEVGFVLNPAAAIGFDNSKVKADPAPGNTINKD